MDKFDFVTGDDFRRSLQEDYRELNGCLEAKAWKAVHVLAGSIVEAILADYLVAFGYKGGNPLQMDFAKIIKACVEEKIIEQDTADLSTVVRQYRNLIHPGRVIRLEKKVDEERAKIAHALVNVIIEEIATQKEKSYGLTAEQLVAKLEHDQSAISIVSHLLSSMRLGEIERLLLKILPEKYFSIEEKPIYVPIDEPYYRVVKAEKEETLKNLANCFHFGYNLAEDTTKAKVMKSFMQILKEEGEHRVFTFELSFFKAPYLAYLTKEESKIVKEHLFARLGKNPSQALFEVIRGTRPFLDINDVFNLLQAIFPIFWRRDYNYELLNVARTFIIDEFSLNLPGLAKDPVKNFLKNQLRRYQELWSQHYEPSIDDYDMSNPFPGILEALDLPEDETSLEDIPF